MDYGAQNQQQKADAAAAQPPATPQTPATPETPAAPTDAAAADDQIVLDDLFPAESKPDAATTPASPTAPVAPAAPATPTDDEKAKADLAQQLADSEAKLNKSLNNSVDQLTLKIDRNNQLATFFQKEDNAPFRKYQDAIVKVSTDPRFIGLSLDRAVAMALGPQVMMKIGAALATDAATRANGNRTGGNSNTSRVINTGTGPDYAKMTDAEFNARTQAVMRGEKVN